MTRSLATSAIVAFFLVITSTAAAQDISEDRLQAAEELLVQIDMEMMLAESVDAILDAQIEQNPHLAPFEDIIASFMREHMSWENLKDEYVRIYAEEFSEEELREITAFYRTETGQKTAELTPVLMRRGMAMGQQIVARHLPELEERLMERAQELQGNE